MSRYTEDRGTQYQMRGVGDMRFNQQAKDSPLLQALANMMHESMQSMHGQQSGGEEGDTCPMCGAKKQGRTPGRSNGD